MSSWQNCPPPSPSQNRSRGCVVVCRGEGLEVAETLKLQAQDKTWRLPPDQFIFGLPTPPPSVVCQTMPYFYLYSIVYCNPVEDVHCSVRHNPLNHVGITRKMASPPFFKANFPNLAGRKLAHLSFISRQFSSKFPARIRQFGRLGGALATHKHV